MRLSVCALAALNALNSVYIAMYAQHTKHFAVQNDIQSRCCAIKLQISTTKANKATNSCKLFFEHSFGIAMAFTSGSTLLFLYPFYWNPLFEYFP